MLRITVLILLSTISWMESKSQNINIEFDEKKPMFYGYSGIHLYSPSEIDDDKHLIIDSESEAISLYKLYFDLAIFLSNDLEPMKKKGQAELIGIFGDNKYDKVIDTEWNAKEGFQIIGLVDDLEIKKYNAFIQKNNLGTIEGIEKYYEGLSKKVKDRLQMTLNNEVVEELQFYLKDLEKFYEQCAKSESVVVIINNGG